MGLFLVTGASSNTQKLWQEKIPHNFPELLGDGTTPVVNQIWTLGKQRFFFPIQIYSFQVSTVVDTKCVFAESKELRWDLLGCLYNVPAVSMDIPTECSLLSEISHSHVSFDLLQNINITPYPPDQYSSYLFLSVSTVKVQYLHGGPFLREQQWTRLIYRPLQVLPNLSWIPFLIFPSVFIFWFDKCDTFVKYPNGDVK